MAHRIVGDGPIKVGDTVRHTGTRQAGTVTATQSWSDGSQELEVETAHLLTGRTTRTWWSSFRVRIETKAHR